jgi:hypothetical protein
VRLQEERGEERRGEAVENGETAAGGCVYSQKTGGGIVVVDSRGEKERREREREMRRVA